MVLPRLGHVPFLSVEEFVEGEEYTYDTICAGGDILFHNIRYGTGPRPIVAQTNEWISPQVIALRDVDDPAVADGAAMGRAVIKGAGFRHRVHHMEWYRKADGEVVFGEIGARPPGAHQVDQMKWACDFDVFRQRQGEAVTGGGIKQQFHRRYNVATIYKRAQGAGRIARIEGAQQLQERFGEHVV